jgi:hypothetical protein
LRLVGLAFCRSSYYRMPLLCVVDRTRIKIWWKISVRARVQCKPGILYSTTSQVQFLSFFCFFLFLICFTWSHLLIHTVGKTPLDEESARRRDLYLTTLTRNRQPCRRRDSNPQSQKASDCRSTPETAPPKSLIFLYLYREPGKLSWYPSENNSWKIQGLFLAMKEVLLSSRPSRPNVGRTQPPIERVSDLIVLG